MFVSQSPSQIKKIGESFFQMTAAQQEIDGLNSQAWNLRIGQKERAYELCTRAADLSRSGDFTSEPYHLGLASSLAIMAIINADIGKPDEAIAQCLEALTLLEGFSPTPALVDVWIAMGWIHIYLGSYPVAFDYGLKALNLACNLKDRHREAWALDAVASTYGVSADADSSISLHKKAALIFREIGDTEGQARTLNNMACTLLESGQLDLALEASRQSLELARQTGMKAETIIFAGTVGDILIAQGDYRQAEEYIRGALAWSGGAVNRFTNFTQYMSLGRVFLAGNRLDEAESNLNAALAIAQTTEMTNDQAECHRLLSEIAERRNDPATALDHYKQFHRLKETTTGEETARRLAILKVTHQSESAMRDAEIYRLRNIELQGEIEERKRVESLLHNMAMFDPLTNLYNRRQFYTLAKLEIEGAKRFEQPLSVLMVDLDHFKRVNDHYGHLAGDQVLVAISKAIRTGLREKDIVGRYGGEEFVALLPETTGDIAFEVGERIRRSVCEMQVETAAGPVMVTMSIGVAEFKASLLDTSSELDQLLGRADQALYCAKHEGRNITHLLNENDFCNE